jgi:isopentenyl phosphate kinase
MQNAELVFIKLGGSVITDKNKPMTPRPDVIQRLADEIASAIRTNPDLHLLIGHGSGSFGHAVANQHQTQSGGTDKNYWLGFAEVWAAARALNQMVINALTQTGVPVIAFPPSAGIITQNRKIESWDIGPIKRALSRGLIPVVHGDVIFDKHLGGTILSTEAVFQYLANFLHPTQILVVGLEEGVYRHYPGKHDDHPYPEGQKPDEIVACITPENLSQVLPGLTSSQSVDVTGGMLAKVESMISLINENPNLTVHIFSGVTPMNLSRALAGEVLGTLIASSIPAARRS